MASSPPYPESSNDKLKATPNGAASRHHHHQHYSSSQYSSENVRVIHQECVRNHAASIGGHAVDGCCGFLACNSADPAEPTSLICAACGCHRNFHRPQFLYPRSPSSSSSSSSSSDLPSPHPHSPSAPVAAHPLLSVRSGGSVASERDPVPEPPRKRFRTKFTPGQKEMMHELAQELDWKMRKTDEAAVEAKCREIGVRRGVFKVWMHNNKHAAVNAAMAAAAAAAAPDQTDSAVQVDAVPVAVAAAAAEGDDYAAASTVAPADEGYGDAAASASASAAAAVADEGHGDAADAADEGDEDAAAVAAEGDGYADHDDINAAAPAADA
ncbi:putative transcription factor ZF-HD family [Dioscorea sansibarensis]